MKKRLTELIVILGSCFIIFTPVAAAAYNPFSDVCGRTAASSSPVQSSAVCTGSNDNTGNDPLTDKIAAITQLVAFIAGIAAIIIIIINGIRYTISSGDSSKVDAAKNGLLGAVIGLVIIVGGQALIVFVLHRI